jgi:hypothetical protein
MARMRDVMLEFDLNNFVRKRFYDGIELYTYCGHIRTDRNGNGFENITEPDQRKKSGFCNG